MLGVEEQSTPCRRVGKRNEKGSDLCVLCDISQAQVGGPSSLKEQRGGPCKVLSGAIVSARHLLCIPQYVILVAALRPAGEGHAGGGSACGGCRGSVQGIDDPLHQLSHKGWYIL
jgi:hypothetical protein